MKPMAAKTFFSYATVAPMGQPAYEAVRKYLDDFREFGPPDVLYKYDPMVDEMSAEAAHLLNCDASEITFINNTTEGINIAADALPLQPGDEILVLANEYPANLLPWLRKRNDGIKVTVVKGTDNRAGYEKLINSISAHTRVITVSTAEYYDGYMPDLELLSSLCQANNIYLVLDAVQTVGIRRIDLQKTPAAFLVAGGQKYLQAGPGSGIIYVNKSIMKELRHIADGIRSMQSFDEETYRLKDTAGRFQLGTQNLPGIVAMTAALKAVNEAGIDNIEKTNQQLLARIKQALTDAGIPFIDHGDRQGNIVSMTVADAAGLTNYLKENDVYIRYIKDVARISFIHTSKIEEIQKLTALTSKWLAMH